MDLNELQAIYKRLYKFIQAERFMRDKVFPEGHVSRKSKLAAADQAMADATALKDALKALLQETQVHTPIQDVLLDVPAATTPTRRKEFA